MPRHRTNRTSHWNITVNKTLLWFMQACQFAWFYGLVTKIGFYSRSRTLLKNWELGITKNLPVKCVTKQCIRQRILQRKQFKIGNSMSMNDKYLINRLDTIDNRHFFKLGPKKRDTSGTCWSIEVNSEQSSDLLRQHFFLFLCQVFLGGLPLDK